MEFDSQNGRDNAEHSGVGFVEIFERFAMQDVLFFGTESFDSLQEVSNDDVTGGKHLADITISLPTAGDQTGSPNSVDISNYCKPADMSSSPPPPLARKKPPPIAADTTFNLSSTKARHAKLPEINFFSNVTT